MMLKVRYIEASMRRWVAALRLTGVGFYVGICIAGGAFVGWWLGGEKPLFLIVGLLVGLVVATYGVYQMIRPLMDNRRDKENG
jgi:F0F1-type ATP synthase assembly protein I